ncbi:MAG: hypothetical protein LBH59_09130 [Planctomycetaceae bacterium]|nr:hypothetical protein [Planctomycetaceae bacterium]
MERLFKGEAYRLYRLRYITHNLTIQDDLFFYIWTYFDMFFISWGNFASVFFTAYLGRFLPAQRN